VNDHESGLIEDIDEWLENLAPFRQDYQHHDTGENNGDSHLKALLVHHQVVVPITKDDWIWGHGSVSSTRNSTASATSASF